MDNRHSEWKVLIEEACCNCKYWTADNPLNEYSLGLCDVREDRSRSYEVCTQHIWVKLAKKKRKK
jgi:hypothetical protein